MKALTIRLGDEQAAQLEVVASIDEITSTQVVREALAAYIQLRRGDPIFRDRLRQRAELVQALAEDQPRYPH